MINTRLFNFSDIILIGAVTVAVHMLVLPLYNRVAGGK